MSDSIKHECGIALMRLLKPLAFYSDKYKKHNYAIEKMFLLMQKQQNRGQDGAGLVTTKLDMPPEIKSLHRVRSNASEPIQEIFNTIEKKISQFSDIRKINGDFSQADILELKQGVPFFGEIYLGHLRYGTFGSNSISECHPFIRSNNWLTRSLTLAGNFNLTNVNQLFSHLLELGQRPTVKADTTIVIEKIGHFLDMENQRLFDKYKAEGIASSVDIYQKIEENMDIVSILKQATKYWDGGFTISGIIGHGDAFVIRDANGIRPAFYYKSEDVVVVASERPVIQTAFDLTGDQVKELPPGHAIIIKKSGKFSINKVLENREVKQCSFERIYFSRGNDKQIYLERKHLGKCLAKRVFDLIKGDTANAVFSYIPNTAETSFFGMVEELNNILNKIKQEVIQETPNIKGEELEKLLNQNIRIEKVAVKDKKLRTFITDGNARDELVVNSYDVTYGIVKNSDTLVILDDSIVRGTTLKKSILAILGRLKPKKIVMVSAAPQVRYPDCYGIDMAKIGKMVAFQAVIELTSEKDNGIEFIKEVYELCKSSLREEDYTVNYVKKIYRQFSAEQISKQIAKLIKPNNLFAELQVIYQSNEGLAASCTNSKGDWYFSGNYPTLGGVRVVNQSFVNWYEKVDQRPY